MAEVFGWILIIACPVGLLGFYILDECGYETAGLVSGGIGAFAFLVIVFLGAESTARMNDECRRTRQSGCIEDVPHNFNAGGLRPIPMPLRRIR